MECGFFFFFFNFDLNIFTIPCVFLSFWLQLKSDLRFLYSQATFDIFPLFFFFLSYIKAKFMLRNNLPNLLSTASWK